MSIDKFTRNVSNPFITDELLIDIKDKNTKVGVKKLDNNTQLIDRTTGEVKSVFSYSYTKQRVDSQKFIKLFTGNLRMLFGLPKRSQLVLEYICNNLLINKDFVYINIGECKEYCGYSTKQSVYNAFSDLLKASIIARTSESYKYWINPNILYNGNRLVIINEYVKEKENTRMIEIEEGNSEEKLLEQRFNNSKLNSNE